MFLSSRVCPPTLWKVGFFVYNGYLLANTFSTRCYFMQLKKYASRRFVRFVIVLEYDFYWLSLFHNRSVLDSFFTAATSPFAAMRILCLFSL